MLPSAKKGFVFAVVLALACVASASSWADSPAGDKYALLVGVKTYIPNELRDLQYAENDVTELGAALTEGGYPAEHVRLLTEAAVKDKPELQPTGKNIFAELDRLAGVCKPGDSVIVAFAGHGVQYRQSDESYFCPMEAKLDDKTTLVAVGEVCRRLEQCKASTKVLLVDACRNDPLPASRSVEKLDLESVTRPHGTVQPGVTAVFFSCSKDEKAFEHADLKHGVFFHFVIEGLRGAADKDQLGTVDLPQLQQYTAEHVKLFVEQKFQTEQTPELIVKTSKGLPPLVTVNRERASLSPFLESSQDLLMDWHGDCDLYAVSPDGKTVVLVKRTDPIKEEFLSVWDLSSGEKKETKLLGATLGMPVALSSDAKFLANEFNGDDALTFGFRVYDLRAQQVRVERKGDGRSGEQILGPLAFTAGGDLMWLSDSDHTLRRLSAVTGKHLPVFPGKKETAVPGALAISANGEVLARAVGDKLEIWNIAQDTRLSRGPWHETEYGDKFWLSPDGKSLLNERYVLDRDKLDHRISIWDTASGQERRSIPLAAGSFFLKAAFCSDGKTAMVRYEDEGDPADQAKDRTELKFFDLATGKERPNATPLHQIDDFAVSCDGAKLATLHRMPKNEWLVKVGDLPMSVRKKP